MFKFSNADVGDRIWSLKWNCWGTITSISYNEAFPLFFMADGGGAFTSLDYAGKTQEDGLVVFYWNETHLPTDDEDKKEEKMSKFSNAEVGDKVWSLYYNDWGTVIGVDEQEISVKHVDGTWDTYGLDGKWDEGDVIPAIFWNKVELPVKDKKPFQLENFFKTNLKVKEFVSHENNCFIAWDTEENKFCYDYDTIHKLAGVMYFYEENMDKVVTRLNEEKVEFKTAVDTIKRIYE